MKPEKPLTDKELEEWENSRDLDVELLDSVRQMKAGKGRVAMSYQEQVSGILQRSTKWISKIILLIWVIIYDSVMG